MPVQPPPEQPAIPPPTLLEGIFKALDHVARRVVSFMPLGRGIRNAMRAPADGLISWDHVTEIAEATLELQQVKPGPISGQLVRQYDVMLRDAEKQVAQYTGLETAGLPERVEVFTQEDWIRANIVSFKFLFDPISARYVRALEDLEEGQAVKARGAQRMARAILSAQVGIIMGYMSRNVLGQFDLSIPEPEKGGRLYVVEPNVHRVELEMGLHPREFRQWITLHEVTHSFEFHCNGWLRGYLTDSMQEYLNTIDWRGISSPDLFRRMRPGRVGRDDALKAGGLLSIIASPEQREILTRLQAVMSVLEGYSNHVMDRVGKDLLSTYETMKERFDRRHEMKSGAEKLFQRLIGISLKLEQYKLGQAFVDAVVGREGIEFLNRVWEGPERMPTMEEIRDPVSWITRNKLEHPPLRLV